MTVKFLTLISILSFGLFTNCNNDDDSINDPVYVGDITLSSQDEVDNFGSSNTQVIGILRLVGPDIQNVENLQNFTSFSGLEIVNTSISDLTPIQQADVSLKLIIEGNTSLEKINFPNVKKLNDVLLITRNNLLTEVALTNLNSIVASFSITNEYNVTEVPFININFPNLKQAGSVFVRLYANDFDLDLSSYTNNSLENGTDFRVTFDRVDSDKSVSINLPSFTGENISSLNVGCEQCEVHMPILKEAGRLSITGTIVDLSSLAYVGGYMWMTVHKEINLKSLVEVNGDIEFDKSNLEVLDLSALVTVFLDIEISNMPNLSSLLLNNLTTTTREVDIDNCPNLFNFCGLLDFWTANPSKVEISTSGFIPSNPTQITGCN